MSTVTWVHRFAGLLKKELSKCFRWFGRGFTYRC